MSFLLRLRPVLLGLAFAAAIVLLGTEHVVARPSRRYKDVAYVAASDSAYDATRHRLDVYAPRHRAAAVLPVVVFIHGGSWNSGNKNFYSFVGRRLARQGIVAVVINYRLAPVVQVPAMAADCARATAWVYRHITDYGGDPRRLYVMGHSAGGGLAALLATKNELFAQQGLAHNPVRGAILDDAAGLDMLDYLQKMQYPGDAQYLVPFGKDPAGWRSVSPLYYLTPSAPPFAVFVGGATYPSIKESSARFYERLRALSVNSDYQVLPGKKHAPMVLQLYWKNNVVYRAVRKMTAVEVQSGDSAE